MKKINRESSVNTVNAASAEIMMAIGRKIATLTEPGMVIALRGGLGAGKTTLVKGVAEGLGVKSEITSPSFTIIKEYNDGRLPLYHMDLYRIDNFEELYMIGFEELIYGSGLSIIEWSENGQELLPEKRVDILITILDDGSRNVDIKGLDFEHSGI